MIFVVVLVFRRMQAAGAGTEGDVHVFGIFHAVFSSRSMRRLAPKARATFSSVPSVRLAANRSSRLTLACRVPMALARSACVMPRCCRSLMICSTSSMRLSSASWAARKSGFCSLRFRLSSRPACARLGDAGVRRRFAVFIVISQSFGPDDFHGRCLVRLFQIAVREDQTISPAIEKERAMLPDPQGKPQFKYTIVQIF